MKKIYNIITFATLVIFLFIGFYGYSGNPVDPPSKPGENTKVIAQPSPSQTDECSGLRSDVPITVIVNITDCPDYKCQFPGSCTVKICVYEGPNLLACQTWDPENCTPYTFDNLRAEESATIRCRFEVTPSGCLTGYNDGWSNGVPVPPGGGTLDLYNTWCE